MLVLNVRKRISTYRGPPRTCLISLSSRIRTSKTKMCVCFSPIYLQINNCIQQNISVHHKNKEIAAFTSGSRVGAHPARPHPPNGRGPMIFLMPQTLNFLFFIACDLFYLQILRKILVYGQNLHTKNNLYYNRPHLCPTNDKLFPK